MPEGQAQGQRGDNHDHPDMAQLARMHEQMMGGVGGQMMGDAEMGMQQNLDAPNS